MSKGSSSNHTVGGTAIQHQPNNYDVFMAQFEAAPLDEVLPEPVLVTWVEFVEEEAKEEDGSPILDAEGKPEIIRKPRLRKSLISTYVPMKVFHKMISSQEKLQRLKVLKAQGQVSDTEREETMAWVISQVSEVWRLTEPNMTDEKLEEGLSFQKIFGLFSRFFGDLLRQWNGLKLS